MSNASNDLALALLATLETHAKKKGRKSVVKQVIAQLRQSGADDALVAKVEALSETAPAKPVVALDTSTPTAKTTSKPKGKLARTPAPAV